MEEANEMEITTKNGRGKSITILILTVLILIVAAYLIKKDLQRVTDIINQAGWAGLLLSVGLYGLLGASPIPSEPFTVIIANLMGPLKATLVAGLGNTLAAMVEYFVGLTIREAAYLNAGREKLPFGLGRFPVDSPMFLIFARFIPGYGSKLVSLIAGVYRVPLWRFVWTTAISTFFGAAIFAFGGFSLLRFR